MRKVTIGVLGILAVGCASTAMFELAPRDNGARWLAGQQWVERGTDGVVIAASFERSWLDRLLFDVSITNRSGSTICVDPGRFSYSLTGSGDELPAQLRKPIAAIDPELELARLDQRMAQLASDHGVIQMLGGVVGVVDLVDDLVASGRRTREEQDRDDRDDREREIVSHGGEEDFATTMANLSELRDRLAASALRRTDLRPGQSIAGKVSLPAGPVRQVVGDPVVEDRFSITSKPVRRAADCTLTLHVPVGAESQDIRYALRRR